MSKSPPTKGYRSQPKSSDQEADKSFVTAMITIIPCTSRH